MHASTSRRGECDPETRRSPDEKQEQDGGGPLLERKATSEAAETTANMLTIVSAVMDRLSHFAAAFEFDEGESLVAALGGVRDQLEVELQAIAFSGERSLNLDSSSRESVLIGDEGLWVALEKERERNVDLTYKITELQHTLRVCTTREIELEGEIEVVKQAERNRGEIVGSGSGTLNDAQNSTGSMITPVRVSTATAIRALSQSLRSSSPTTDLTPDPQPRVSLTTRDENRRLRELVDLSGRHAAEVAQQYALLFTRCKRQLCLADGENDGLRQLVDYLRGSNSKLQGEIRELRLASASAPQSVYTVHDAVIGTSPYLGHEKEGQQQFADQQREALYLELKSLRDEAAEIAAQRDDASIQVRKAWLEAQSKQQLLDEVTAKGHAVSEQYSQLVLTHAQLQQELVTAEETHRMLLSDFEQVRADVVQLEAQLSTVRGRNATLNSALEERLAELTASQDCCTALSSALSRSESCRVEQEEEIVMLKARVVARESALSDATTSSQRLETRVVELEAEFMRACKAEESSASALVAMHSHQRELAAAEEAWSKRLEGAESRLASLTESNSKLDARAQAAECEAAGLKATVETLETSSCAEQERRLAHLAHVESTLTVERQVSALAAQELVNARHQLSCAHLQTAQVEAALTAALQNAADHAAKREAIASQLAREQGHSEALLLEVTTLRGVVDGLGASLSAAAGVNATARAECGDLEAKLATQRIEAEELQSRITALIVENKRADDSLQLMRNREARLDKELTATHESLQQQEAIAAAQQRELRDIQQQLKQNQEKLESKDFEMSLLVEERDALSRALSEAREREALAVSERNAAVEMHEQALAGAQALMLQSKDSRETAEREKNAVTVAFRDEVACIRAEADELVATLDAERAHSAAQRAREREQSVRTEIIEVALKTCEQSLADAMQREARALATIDALAEGKEESDDSLRDRISRENVLLVTVERQREEAIKCADQLAVLQRSHNVLAEQLAIVGPEMQRLRHAELEALEQARWQQRESERVIVGLSADRDEAVRDAALARAVLTLPPAPVSASGLVVVSEPSGAKSLAATVAQDLARKLALWEEQRRPLREASARLNEVALAIRTKFEEGSLYGNASEWGASMWVMRSGTASTSLSPARPCTSVPASAPASPASVANSADALVAEIVARTTAISDALPWLQSLRLGPCLKGQELRSTPVSCVDSSTTASSPAATCRPKPAPGTSGWVAMQTPPRISFKVVSRHSGTSELTNSVADCGVNTSPQLRHPTPCSPGTPRPRSQTQTPPRLLSANSEVVSEKNTGGKGVHRASSSASPSRGWASGIGAAHLRHYHQVTTADLRCAASVVESPSSSRRRLSSMAVGWSARECDNHEHGQIKALAAQLAHAKRAVTQPLRLKVLPPTTAVVGVEATWGPEEGGMSTRTLNDRRVVLLEETPPSCDSTIGSRKGLLLVSTGSESKKGVSTQPFFVRHTSAW